MTYCSGSAGLPKGNKFLYELVVYMPLLVRASEKGISWHMRSSSPTAK